MGKNRKTAALPTALLARGAIYTALCVALLFPAYAFETLDMAMATLASVFIYVARLEHGAPFAGIVYFCASFLGFLLMSLNTGVTFFALVFGWFPLLYAFAALKIKKTWLARCLSGFLFTIAFSFVVILFFKTFVSQTDLAVYTERICELLALDAEQIVEKLNSPFFMGLSFGEGLSILLYALLAFLFSFLLALFFDKFTLFYVYKIRPILKKAGVIKK